MSRKRVGVLLASIAAMVGLALAVATAVQGAGTPANKVWVAADTTEIMTTGCPSGTPIAPCTQDQSQVVLMHGHAKYSNPTDLRISVTSECALWTNTATTGNDDSEAKARVEMWVTIDDKVVPVAANDTAANNTSVDPEQQAGKGRVVFCNRANRMKTESMPDDNMVIRSFSRTRDANGFNWGALNAGTAQSAGGYDSPANGNNILDIEVHARLADSLTDDNTADNNPAIQSPFAKAAVGKRTMFVEPVHMATDASF
jgi:hypothetical protein